MKRNSLLFLVLLMSLHTGTARATPSADTLACVAASTTGQTERDEGHLLAARRELLSCARDLCPTPVRQSCGEWLADLELRLPSVVVRVHDDHMGDLTAASVAIDGVVVPLDGRPVVLDPGEHTLHIRAPGFAEVQRTFLLAEREKARLLSIQLALTPAGERHPPERDPRRQKRGVPLGAWLVGGVGVVGIVSFVAVGSKARHDLNQLLRTCSPNCSAEQRHDGERKVLAANVSLGIGVAALVGASVWTLASLMRDKRTSHSPTLSLLPMPTGWYGSLQAHY